MQCTYKHKYVLCNMHSLTLGTRTYVHDTYYVYTAKLPYYNTNIRTYIYTCTYVRTYVRSAHTYIQT